jgi:hypothetical protein
MTLANGRGGSLGEGPSHQSTALGVGVPFLITLIHGMMRSRMDTRFLGGNTEFEVFVMMKRGILLAVFLFMVLGSTHHSFSWDETGDRLILEKAIDALPRQMKKFYEEREAALLALIEDPVEMGHRLTFEVDRLAEFPFEDIPESQQGAVSRFGEDRIAEAGDLPWRIMETYEKLTEAFQNMDIQAIESLSAEIAYQIGELHNPVNVSRYGDGESIDQHGLRERFDERLLEVYGTKLKVETPTSIYLDRPSEYVFNIVRKGYVWVDNILLHDYVAHRGVMSYDRFYYEGLWARTSVILSQMFESLSRDIASFWYTAWVNAGKPELPKK